MTGRRSLAVALLLGATALTGAGCVSTVWVPVGPPEEIVEEREPMPAAGFVWVDGYWMWHSRWEWQRGHWASPPHAGATWVRGHWERDTHGWRWHEGYWR